MVILRYICTVDGFFFYISISKEQHSWVYCTFRNQLRNGVGDPALDCEFSV